MHLWCSLCLSRSCFFFFFFFFSSRRRHTRSLCDWSSDVCSSDLDTIVRRQHAIVRELQPPAAAFEKLGAKIYRGEARFVEDRKSTRLNSSHTVISYAVFCLKKKTKTKRSDPCHSRAASCRRVGST